MRFHFSASKRTVWPYRLRPAWVGRRKKPGWHTQSFHLSLVARRTKNDGVAEALHELFLEVPAWWCLPIALVAFGVVQTGIIVLAAANPIF
jgi:hypothetical protein